MAKKKINAAKVTRMVEAFETSREVILTGNRAERYMAEKRAKASLLQSALDDLALQQAMYEAEFFQSNHENAAQATGPAL